MASRPYFRFSIEELEKLFESSRDNRALLIQLDEELSNRDRPRAKALARKVADCLAMQAQPKSGEHLVSPMQSEPKPGVSSGSSGIVDVSTRAGSSSSPPQNSRTNPKPLPISPVEQERVVVKPSPFPRTVDFSDATSQFALEVEAKPGPDSVLAAWVTLEVLTPQALPNARELESIGRTLVRLEEYPEPWKEQRFLRRGKERTVHWMVYLGELDLEKATKTMLNKYPDEAVDERADVRGNTTLAVMVVDNQGRPAEGKTFLSSFAWGYGQVRAGRLKGLAAFPEAERAIKTELEKRLVRQNEQGEILPLSYSDIQAAINWLIKVLNIPEEEVIRPGIAVRVPQWGLYNEPPQPEILNSFFITDLAKTREAFDCGHVGKALSVYMGVGLVQERQNVVCNKGIIAKTLAPDRMPLTRWPSPGRHPLVLMQQAAVNHSVVEVANGGMVAVNGPPGTGKTTLLRDIVAKVVLDRAIAMSKFDKPVQAFTHVAQMMTGRAYTHLYKLDESLIGHEIVVASSNNKAVENISREIPASKAMASTLSPQARYFQSISDAVAAGKGPIKDGATWGLAAAVLGNSSNRSAFTQSFYWHKNRGMARYLKAILGGDAPEDDEEDGEEGDEPRLLDVVAIEQPPRGEIEALERWRIARRDFLAKLKNVEALQKQAQAAYEAVTQRSEAVRRVADITCRWQEAKRSYVAALDREELTKRLHVRAVDAERRAAEDRTAIDRLRPGFFARLCNLRSYREWRIQMMAAQSA